MDATVIFLSLISHTECGLSANQRDGVFKSNVNGEPTNVVTVNTKNCSSDNSFKNTVRLPLIPTVYIVFEQFLLVFHMKNKIKIHSYYKNKQGAITIQE